jgi:ABC-2 type transport system permease protein
VEAALLMVSGVYYPISVLPGWMQMLAKISPATYTLQGMRAALGVGKAEFGDLPVMIGVLLLQGAILVPLGALVFRIAETHAKRTGKLARSG